MKRLIASELNNKLFNRRSDNLVNNTFIFNKNFLVSGTKSFRLIKNIIELELFLGQRPWIMASYIKKSLVINLKITKNSKEINYLPLLQKSPVLWKKYSSQFNLFKDLFNLPPFLSDKSHMTVKMNKLSKYNSWLKSAYLD